MLDPLRRPTAPIAAVLSAWLTLTIATAATAAHTLHPQDGPHADIRIRVDPDAVTCNVTVNLVWADEVCPAIREAADTLHESEEPILRETLEAFFRDDNQVTIDGLVVSPRFDEFEITRATEPALLALFPNTGARGLIRARLKLTYPALTAPRTVGLKWGGYPPDFTGESTDGIQIVEAQLVAESATWIIRFTRDEPEYVWHGTGTSAEERFQAVPTIASGDHDARTISVVALACLLAASISLLLAWIARAGHVIRTAPAVVGCVFIIAAGATADRSRVTLPGADRLPAPDEALDIFWPIHANIYRAFDYDDESDVYDALARSVSGELLESLYEQIYRSLILYEEGGAVSRVTGVDPLDAEITTIGRLPDSNRTAFNVRARWQVEGSVYHWGHSHVRRNEYLADYTVTETDDGWRIADNTVIEQFRLEIEQPAFDPESIGEL